MNVTNTVFSGGKGFQLWSPEGIAIPVVAALVIIFAIIWLVNICVSRRKKSKVFLGSFSSGNKKKAEKKKKDQLKDQLIVWTRVYKNAGAFKTVAYCYFFEFFSRRPVKRYILVTCIQLTKSHKSVSLFGITLWSFWKLFFSELWTHMLFLAGEISVLWINNLFNRLVHVVNWL